MVGSFVGPENVLEEVGPAALAQAITRGQQEKSQPWTSWICSSPEFLRASLCHT